MKSLLLIPFLLLAVSSNITPSPNFNITDFVGEWTYAGFYSEATTNIALYSCAKFNVARGSLTVLTFTESWIDNTTNLFVTQVQTLLPSPLNNAILISTTAPTSQNNFVVAYYNTTAGQAILINQAATKAYLLTRNDVPEAQESFLQTASSILTQASINPSSVIPIYGLNCDYGTLQPLKDFDLSLLNGNEFYANVAFAPQGFTGVQDDTFCATINFTQVGQFLSLNFTQGQDADNETVLPYPGLPAVFIDTNIRYSNPLTITYQDTENNAFLVFRWPNAIGLSVKTFMKPVIANNIIKSLESQGFTVNATNFLIIPQSCYPSAEEEKTFLSY